MKTLWTPWRMEYAGGHAEERTIPELIETAVDRLLPEFFHLQQR